MWGRRLRSKLDLVLPDAERRSQEAQDRQKRSHDCDSADRHFGVNDTVYVRNYGVGQQWLPGRVVGLQGSVMYRVRLDNNDVIIRHVDQLRHRVATTDSTDSSNSSDLSDVSVPETGVSTEMVEPESAETDQNSSDTSETPDIQITPSSTPAEEAESSESAEEQTEDHSGDTVVVPSQEHDSSEQPERAGTPAGLRRSSRVSRPPVRLDETVTRI